jgi:ABC-type multidrug transport system ATPase subunit
LDEPFAHLDSLGCSQAYMWINTQLNLKKTIIFTHQCSEGLKDIQSLQIFDLNGY